MRKRGHAMASNGRLIAVVVLRFVVTVILAMVPLTFVLVIAFIAGDGSLSIDDGRLSLWQGVAFFLAAGLFGLLEVLMYLRKRRASELSEEEPSSEDT